MECFRSRLVNAKKNFFDATFVNLFTLIHKFYISILGFFLPLPSVNIFQLFTVKIMMKHSIVSNEQKRIWFLHKLQFEVVCLKPPCFEIFSTSAPTVSIELWPFNKNLLLFLRTSPNFKRKLFCFFPKWTSGRTSTPPIFFSYSVWTVLIFMHTTMKWAHF